MDLLTQFEPTLQALKSVGTRGAELDEQIKALRSRTEADRASFEARSRDLVPRSQALVQKFAKTQVAVHTSFTGTTARIRSFRDHVHSLQQQCQADVKRLFDEIGVLQAEHEGLRQSAEDLENHTQGLVFSHGVAVQDKMQQIAPELTGLDETLGKRIIPSAVSLGHEVGTHTTALSGHVETTVVPGLLQHTDTLGKHLSDGASAVKDKAHQLASDLEAQTETLMREALAAARRIHDQSNARLLRLAGVIPTDIEAIFTLIKEVQRAMRGLHTAQRKASGVLDVIVEIITGLVQLLKNIEAGAQY